MATPFSRWQPFARWLAMSTLIASLAILVFAWVERGYAPRLRISGESMQRNGQLLSPMAFSPSGETLAVVSRPFVPSPTLPSPATIRFLSASDGTEVQPDLPLSQVAVEEIQYSPNGKLLAVLRHHGYGTMLLDVFDLATRESIADKRITFYAVTGSGGPEGQISFGFSPDSSAIYWSGRDTEGAKWSRACGVLDLSTRKERFSLKQTGGAMISPNSQLLATIDDFPKKELQLWSAQTGELLRSITMSQSGYFRNPDFSPDSRLVAFSGDGSKTEVFDVTTGKLVFEQRGGLSNFLAQGHTLVMVLGFDVQLWDTDSWKLRSSHKFDKLGRGFWTGDPITPWPTVVPNRSMVAVVTNDARGHWSLFRWLGRVGQLNTWGTGRLNLINAEDGTLEACELHEIDPVVTRTTNYGTHMVWSPDGSRAAFSQDDLVVWDLPPRPTYVTAGLATALAMGATLFFLALIVAGRRAGQAASRAPGRE